MAKEYRVSANGAGGKRVVSDRGLFKGKSEAMRFAEQTNQFRKGSNARVVFN